MTYLSEWESPFWGVNREAKKLKKKFIWGLFMQIHFIFPSSAYTKREKKNIPASEQCQLKVNIKIALAPETLCYIFHLTYSDTISET